MPTLHFSIRIAAAPHLVWDTMLSHGSYEDWTSAFSPGSTYHGAWTTGARVRFVASDGNNGMLSEIAESRRPEFLSIRHVGMLENGVEVYDSPEVLAWAPAFENYEIRAVGADSELAVSLDTPDAWVDMMNSGWNRALPRLKQLCEEGAQRAP